MAMQKFHGWVTNRRGQKLRGVQYIAGRPISAPPATLELIWRDPSGTICKKSIPWRNKPCTDQVLEEYLKNYLNLVAEGYMPPGFTVPPIPHCARIHSQGSVKAEWMHPDPAVRLPVVFMRHHA